MPETVEVFVLVFVETAVLAVVVDFVAVVVVAGGGVINSARYDLISSFPPVEV